MAEASDNDGEASFAAQLWEFDEQVRADPTLRVVDWLAKEGSPAHQEEYACLLLRAGCDARGFDWGWLADQLADSRLEWLTKSARLNVLRAVFQDLVETGRTPRWSEFESFGYPAELLALRCEQDALALGTVVGESWRLEARLGAGGCGTVYLGHSLVDDTPVAIKTPRRDSDGLADVWTACLRHERHLLQRFNLPGVPRLIAWLDSDPCPLLIMEYVAGQSLEERLDAGPLSVPEALRVVRDVASVVDSLHQHDHLHGDIKPANIVLGSTGGVSLLDFGLAHDAQLHPGSGIGIGGTLEFMSTEAKWGFAREPSQDVWALGTLLYCLVTGSPTVLLEMRSQTLAQIVLTRGSEQIPFTTEIPRGVRALCRCALAFNGYERLETAGDFAQACAAVLEDPEVEVVVPLRPRLVAWRLGCILADLQRRLAIVAEESRKLTEPQADANADDQQVSHDPFLQTISHSVCDLESAETLARQLNVTLKPWKYFDTCQMIMRFYLNGFQQRFSPRQLINVPLIAESTTAWSNSTLAQLRGQLAKSQSTEIVAWFDLGRDRLAVFDSPESRQRWLAALKSGGLPAVALTAWRQLAYLHDSEQFERGIRRMERALVRYLRWGLESFELILD